MKQGPTKKILRAAIRGSVPHGKLRKARIVLADSRNSSIGGFTDYNPLDATVTRIGCPNGDDAYSSSVRGHETIHATFDSKKSLRLLKPLTEQQYDALNFVDDIRGEQRPLPKATTSLQRRSLERYRRDHLSVAVDELRRMKRNRRNMAAGLTPNTLERRNKDIMFGARIFAMLTSYRQGADSRTNRAMAKHLVALRNLVGGAIFSAFPTIKKLAQYEDKRMTALGALLAMLERDEADSEGDYDLPPMVEDEKGTFLLPVSWGSGIEGHMSIVDLLPKNAFTAREHQPERAYCPSGPILNARRFVPAIVGCDANGLFSRIIKDEPGGCVVIDASGSMGATTERLVKLCQSVPQATVAYYSGEDCDGVGNLFIYAKDGKRYNGPLPPHSGGNSVDLPALLWLLRHPKPWTFVSDLEFCGGVYGAEQIAHSLVRRHEASGELKVCRSLEEAFEFFGAEWGRGRGWEMTHAESVRQSESGSIDHDEATTLGVMR
jgi:hypothetical protein